MNARYRYPYGRLHWMIPIPLIAIGWYRWRWPGAVAGAVAGTVLALVAFSAAFYFTFRSYHRRKRRDVSLLSTDELKQIIADPSSPKFAYAIGELAGRGIDARPTVASICELLASDDSRRRGQGMSLLHAMYPERFARLPKGSSNLDSPAIWRERIDLICA